MSDIDKLKDSIIETAIKFQESSIQVGESCKSPYPNAEEIKDIEDRINKPKEYAFRLFQLLDEFKAIKGRFIED
jgi:hypothetical protein